MRKFLMFFGLTALICTTGCHTKKAEKEEGVKYLFTSPIKKDTSINREYVCQIHAIQHIELRALERGYLEGIFVDEGKPVRKGQKMFQIMPIIYQAELQQAQAEVNYADIEYQNTKRLADSNIVAPTELALVKAKLEKAKAALSLAQAHLQFAEIKAPFDGIMDKFYVRQGSLLDEGDLLTTLSDISTLWVYFNVPEAEYLNYKEKAKNSENLMDVKLRMANQEIYKYPGVVKTIEADFNNETGNIAFRATFPNPEKLLRHGETGNIIVQTDFKNAIIIPQKATFEVLDQKYVYVLDKDSVLRTRRIFVAAEMPNLFIIKEGLTENDKILLEGLRLVSDGDKITNYEFENMNKVMNGLGLHAE